MNSEYINILKDDAIENENRYRILIENTSDLIAITKFSLKPVYTYINPSYTRFLGYQPEELLGRDGFDFIHPNDKYNLIQLLKKYVMMKTKEIIIGKEQEITEKIEFRIKDKAGDWHDLESTVNFVGNELIFVSKDTTEQKKNEEQIKESELRFRNLFQYMKCGVAIYTAVENGEDFLFNDCNRAAELIENINKKNLIGKRLTEVFPGVKKFGLFEVLKNVWETGIPSEHLDAFYIDERISGWRENFVYKLPSGEIVCIYNDISELKQKDEDLRRYVSFIDRIMDYSPFAMWISDADGTVIRTNNALRNFLNLDDGQIIGKYNVLNDENLIEQGVMSDVKAVFKKRKPTRFTIRWEASKVGNIIFNEGNDLWIEVSMFPITNDEGDLLNVVCQWIDITLIKEGKRKLQQAHDELIKLNKKLENNVQERTEQIEELLKQKDEFINQLGHDLKNPIGPLIQLIPILEKNETDEKKKEMLQVLNRNVDYMKNLISRIMQLAQLSSTTYDLQFETICLCEEIEEILKTNKMMFENNKINIINNVHDDISLTVDKLKFHELFNNILNNAVKYSNKNNSSITLDQWICNDGFITLSIKDNGIGMTREQLDNVFNEFYKADESRHDFDSSGLGMPIAKRIVEMHKGKIWVESEGIGNGSTFYFSLPKDVEKISKNMLN